MRIRVTGRSKPVGYSAWKEEVAARAGGDLLAIADDGKLAIQYIKRFIFGLVQMVRCLEMRRRCEMEQRI